MFQPGGQRQKTDRAEGPATCQGLQQGPGAGCPGQGQGGAQEKGTEGSEKNKKKNKRSVLAGQFDLRLPAISSSVAKHWRAMLGKIAI